MSMLTSLQALLDRAENHPIIKKIKEDQYNETLDKKHEAAARIKELEIERDSKIKELRKDLSAKESEYSKIRKLLDGVTREYNSAKAALASESNRYEREIDQQKNILLNNYDSAIDEAIEFFNQKLTWLRQPGRSDSQIIATKNNLISLEKETVTVSNLEAINNALLYCQRAIREIENLKLLPELDILYIESLKAGVPGIDDFNEISGLKQMEKGQFAPRLLSGYEIEQIDKRAAALDDKLTTLNIHERIEKRARA